MRVSMGCIYAFTLFCLDYSRIACNGQNSESDDAPDIKYAAIGAGIGAFLALCFILSKLYMINKHVEDNELSEPDSSKHFYSRTDKKCEES